MLSIGRETRAEASSLTLLSWRTGFLILYYPQAWQGETPIPRRRDIAPPLSPTLTVLTNTPPLPLLCPLFHFPQRPRLLPSPRASRYREYCQGQILFLYLNEPEEGNVLGGYRGERLLHRPTDGE
jgi:hypothetical protein